MGHQVIKLQNPLKTLGFLQFYRFKTVKDRIITQLGYNFNIFLIFTSSFCIWYTLKSSCEELNLPAYSPAPLYKLYFKHHYKEDYDRN